MNVFGSCLHETYKDSGVDHVDKESKPKIG